MNEAALGHFGTAIGEPFRATRWIYFKAGSDDVPAYGMVELYDATIIEGDEKGFIGALTIFKGRKPTLGTGTAAYLINGPTPIPADQVGRGSLAVEYPVYALYEGNAPNAGETVGPTAGKFTVGTAGSGFVAIYAGTNNRVWVLAKQVSQSYQGTLAMGLSPGDSSGYVYANGYTATTPIEVGNPYHLSGAIYDHCEWETNAMASGDDPPMMLRMVETKTIRIYGPLVYSELSGGMVQSSVDIQAWTNAPGPTTLVWTLGTPCVQNPDSTDTETSCTCSPSSAVVGQTVTLTAHVTGENHPIGFVTFYDYNGVVLGEALLASGSAVLNCAIMSYGDSPIVASYQGDRDNNPSNGKCSVTIDQADTTAEFHADPSEVTYGDEVTFTVNVRAQSPGSGTPTGTVTFKQDSTTIATRQLDGTGYCTYVTTKIKGGERTLTATYNGDANFNPSDSDGVSITVDKKQLTVTADDKTTPRGVDPLPTFTASYAGFVNGEGSGELTGSPSFTCNDKQGNPVGPGTDAGTYSITPAIGSLSANNYSFASFVAGTLTITKVDLTVTADDKTMTQGESAPEFSVSYDGFINDEDESVVSGDAAYTCNDSEGKPVGPDSYPGVYPITPALGSLSADNYDFRPFVDGSLTINPGPSDTTVEFHADPSEITYGDEVTFMAIVRLKSPGNGRAATGTVTFKQGSTTIATRQLDGTGYCTYVTTKIKGGERTLTATYNGDANFNPSDSDGVSITVDKKQLTVTADDKTTPRGVDPLPTFTASYAGFVNGEGSGVLTGVASFTCDDDNGDPVTRFTDCGDYDITPEAGSGSDELTSDDYSFLFVPGTLTITKVDLTVTADDKNMIAGGTVPTFTASYSGFVNNEDSSVLTGSPSFTCNDKQGNPVGPGTDAGTYSITPAIGSLSANNYSFASFVAGTLTINAAPGG